MSDDLIGLVGVIVIVALDLFAEIVVPRIRNFFRRGA